MEKDKKLTGTEGKERFSFYLRVYLRKIGDWLSFAILMFFLFCLLVSFFPLSWKVRHILLIIIGVLVGSFILGIFISQEIEYNKDIIKSLKEYFRKRRNKKGGI